MQKEKFSLKMDFDSPDPDVEKEFPGLFASESSKKDEDDCKYNSVQYAFVTKIESLRCCCCCLAINN